MVNSGTPAPFSPAGSDDFLNWLFPVHQINRRLPSWFRIGGEYRGRLEGPTGIGFTWHKRVLFVDRVCLRLGIRPKEWLLLYGETQDSRVFFNHHIPNANPYEDKWTVWQATTRGQDYGHPYAYFDYNFSKSDFHFPIMPQISRVRA